MSQTSSDAGSTAGPSPHPPFARRLMPAGRVLIVMLVALLTWTLLYAPTLKRAAEASPIGVRRTVSLAVLTPIAAISGFLGLDALSDAIERAVGHASRPSGPFVPPPDDLPIAPDGGEGPLGGPSDENEPIRDPTPTRRLRVVVVGDSLAAGLGYFAERIFRPKFVRVSRQGRISTGLARPDYFNWPVAMRRIVDVFDPDLVIVMIGENDHQSLEAVSGRLVAQSGTSEWPTEYRHRVLQMMRIATSRGAKVVWAGLPVPADVRLRDRIRRQNDIFEFAASVSRNVTYFDAWERFMAPRGGYTAFFREGGHVVLIREGDGLHFNAVGYTILAREIAEVAAMDFGLAPRTFETEV